MSPDTSLDVRRKLSGLEFFRMMLSGEAPHPPMLNLLGIRLVEVEAGRVVFAANVDEARHGARVLHQLDNPAWTAVYDARAQGQPDPPVDGGGQPAPL